MSNFKPFSVTITQELDILLFKALLSLIKTEQNADSIVQAAAVISYFNQVRLESKENQKSMEKEEIKEEKEQKTPKEKVKKS